MTALSPYRKCSYENAQVQQWDRAQPSTAPQKQKRSFVPAAASFGTRMSDTRTNLPLGSCAINGGSAVRPAVRLSFANLGICHYQ